MPNILTVGCRRDRSLDRYFLRSILPPLVIFLRRKSIDYHLYADDTQLWVTFKPNGIDNAISHIESCVELIQQWMCQYHLKMNDDKTEFLVISSKPVSRMFAMPSLKVGEQSIVPSSTARNLGGIKDPHVSMVAHILSICRSCYLHIYNINKLRKFMDCTSLEHIVHAFITTKLDYCNSLLSGIPSTLTQRLQRIHNTAARILTSCGKHAHITPVSQSLHWLPVEQRIKYKTLLLVFKSINGLAPTYLSELLVHHVPFRGLRSKDQNLLHVPFTRSAMVQNRAFSVAGPRQWNLLPCSIRNITSLPLFKSKLKTFLFTEYYGNC